MDIMSFVLGIASAIALIINGVIAVGIVKIMKCEENVSGLKSELEDLLRYTDNEFSAVRREIEDGVDDRTQELNDVYTELRSLQSYVDSRIDKSLNK